MASLAPWRSPLARALHRNRSLTYARYLQLATLRSTGRPANRTVVFRGFLPDTNQVQMITDRRSQKVEQWHHQPASELCWYFPKTREQFRLSGMLTLVTADSEAHQADRHHLWQTISAAARTQFAWPTPGHPRASDPITVDRAQESDRPLDNFCLLLLDPDWVDHLELRGDPHTRHTYDRQGDQWIMQAVNP